jgi:hypothetical protein
MAKEQVITEMSDLWPMLQSFFRRNYVASGITLVTASGVNYGKKGFIILAPRAKL